MKILRKNTIQIGTIWDVAVVGGGPAGMMAAGRAAELGAKVILLEKNPNLGKKLLISGGGRCNVLNATFDNRKLLERYGVGGKFLFSTFSQHNATDSLNFFNSRGMATKVEAEDRVFPASDSSRSVLEVLVNYLKQGNVTVMMGAEVAEITADVAKIHAVASNKSNADAQNFIQSIKLKNGDKICAKSFIIATGGKACPETGSTGEGFIWLKKLGHNIIKPDSSLVPIIIKEPWIKELQGVSMPEVKISILQENSDAKLKKVETKKGKILFTHFGVSGPTILNMSKKVSELLSYGDVTLSLDIAPRHDFATLNEMLQKLFKKEAAKMIKNVLVAMAPATVVPAAFVPIILKMANIDPDKTAHDITREERIRLMKTLKDIPMRVGGLLGIENSIVSSGGVDLVEVDFKTMRSRLFKNLYVVGDMLNIDRPSGGYSLQLCWTTGFVAGTHSIE